MQDRKAVIAKCRKAAAVSAKRRHAAAAKREPVKTVQLAESVWRKVREFADRDGLTMSEAIGRAIDAPAKNVQQ